MTRLDSADARPRKARKGKRGRRGRPGGDDALLVPIGVSVGLTLLLRLVYLLTTENPFWRSLGLDLGIYDLWARRILESPPFGGDVLGQAPFFPVALSVAYSLLGADPVRALFVHLVPAGIATASVAWVAGRWKGKVGAWTAGVLAALHAPSIFYTGVLLPPSWVLGLSALLLALGYRNVVGVTGASGSSGAMLPSGRSSAGRAEVRSTPGWPGLVATGLTLGLLVWAQPVCLVLLFPLLVCCGSIGGARDRPVAVRRGAERPGVVGMARAHTPRAGWQRAGWILAGLAMPLSVSFFYNVSRGAPALVAVNGGINFYIGNGLEATGAYVRPAGMEENRDLLGVGLASRLLAQERSGGRDAVPEGGSGPTATGTDRSELNRSTAGAGGAGTDAPLVDRRRADRFWWERGIREVGAHPGRTLALYVRKLGFFFTNYEIPQVESLPYESRFSWLLLMPLPGMAVLVSGTVLGAGLLLRRDPVARWILASVLLLALAVAVFFVTARFRIPVVPWMLVLTGAGVAELWRVLRDRGPGRQGPGRTVPAAVPAAVAVLAVVAGLLSAFAPTGIVTDAANGQYVFREALIAEEAGDFSAAVSGYRRALEIDPSLAKANVNLGTLLARSGELDDARTYLERGVALDPTSGIGHQNLGQLHEVEGRSTEALVSYEAALEAEPQLVSARESAGYLLHRLGRIDESRLHLQEIVRSAPKGSPPELRAGTLFSLVSERREAVRRLSAEGARADWWASNELLRADVLLAQRQIAESAASYREALLDPGVAAYAELVLTQLESTGVLRGAP